MVAVVVRPWRRTRPYWQPGPFKALRPADLVGTWIASFGLGMNKQLFTFLLVGDRLRGVVCGRCDNPYTIGAMENIIIVGDRLYFDIVHQDWGEIDPPTFDRSIVAQVVQNEMLAAILPNVSRSIPPAPPRRRRDAASRSSDRSPPHGRAATVPKGLTSGDRARALSSSRLEGGHRSGPSTRAGRWLLEFLHELLAFSADFINELGVRGELLAEGHRPGLRYRPWDRPP